MSGKSKKTTADRTICNDKQTKYISHSATKMVNKLSLSFYAQNTLRMQKQVILDTYDDFDTESPISRTNIKPSSLSRGKIAKPKTPIIKFTKHEAPNLPIPSSSKPIKACKVPQSALIQKQKKNMKNVRDRSSSRSSRGKNGNSIIFNYISNRIDGTAKGWNVLKAPNQNKNNNNNKRQKEKQKW